MVPGAPDTLHSSQKSSSPTNRPINNKPDVRAAHALASRAYSPAQRIGHLLCHRNTYGHAHHFRSAKRLGVLQRDFSNSLRITAGAWKRGRSSPTITISWAILPKTGQTHRTYRPCSMCCTPERASGSTGWMERPSAKSGSTLERRGLPSNVPISRALIMFIRTQSTTGLFRWPISIRGVLRPGLNDPSHPLR